AQVQRVSGSAWSPARNIAGTRNYGFNGFAMRNNITTAPRNYSFGLNNYHQAFTPFNDQSRPLYTPRYGGEFQNYSLGGWRGNGAVVAPRGGGFFNNYFRGGAPAGGFRGGSGWAGGHLGGAGGGGGGWGGGGHGAGGGGWGGGGGGGGHGGR
ncbi:MAG TPA: hypothetical protein VMH30_07650, partial [Verrucomicrobiae bacterium]|nr:hypothetical protein [Verrucomicrobiae bacterium]